MTIKKVKKPKKKICSWGDKGSPCGIGWCEVCGEDGNINNENNRTSVIVTPTKRKIAYTIVIYVEGQKFTMGTGTDGLEYDEAVEKAKAIAYRMHCDIGIGDNLDLSIDRYPPKR